MYGGRNWTCQASGLGLSTLLTTGLSSTPPSMPLEKYLKKSCCVVVDVFVDVVQVRLLLCVDNGMLRGYLGLGLGLGLG